MKVGIIQASSQSEKNGLLYDTTKKYAADSQVINFGCRPDEKEQYTYVEISVLIGLLLNSKAVDFIVTGCSSGQGMMLACNSMPGVLCGYAPAPMDAYLFCQINNGNAISLPLGEGYTWNGYENFEKTIAKVFSEPFGQGYPKGEAERKQKDTAVLKTLRQESQRSMPEFLEKIDSRMIEKILHKKDVIDYVLEYGNQETADWLKSRIVDLNKDVIGSIVKGTVDRPMGSAHPKHPEIIYPINYGYVDGVMGGDGEEQDVYILGADEPLMSFEGRVIAVYHRTNDNEDKWIVSLDGRDYSDNEILETIRFQEQFYQGILLR